MMIAIDVYACCSEQLKQSRFGHTFGSIDSPNPFSMGQVV
jgi:hypothetical protein